MNQKDLLDYFDKVTAEMRATMVKKNSDYTGGDTDPFANFSAVESLDFGVSTEQGILVRMTDKIRRIASFVKQGTLQVKDESVHDTLLDLANYCILFSAFLLSKKNKENRKGPNLDCLPGSQHLFIGGKCQACGMHQYVSRGDVIERRLKG